MDEIDREAERLLATFRAADTFEDDRQRRVRRRLARSLARPMPAWVDELDELRPASEPSHSQAWWWGAAAAVVLAFVAVAGWRGRAHRGDTAAPHEAIDDRAPRDSSGVATPRRAVGRSASDAAKGSTPPAEPGPSAPADEPRPSAQGGDPRRPRAGTDARSPRREADSSPSPKPTDPGLRLELQRIDQIDAALRRGDLSAAARALADYEQQFERGQLREEARGLRVILACRQRAAGATAAATRYLSRHPRSMFEGRIERACQTEGENPAEATDSWPPVQSPIDDTP